jgi:hypothetical protein
MEGVTVQTIRAASEDESKTGSRVLLGLQLTLGFLQVSRGALNWSLDLRSYMLGPPSPPGLDISIFHNPIFSYLCFIDIFLIVMILLLRKSRIPFFVQFSLDFALVFEVVWYRFAVYRPYDWLLMWYGIGVSMLSILHLALLLAWDLVSAKESETIHRTRSKIESPTPVLFLLIMGSLQALRGLLNLVSYSRITMRIDTARVPLEFNSMILLSLLFFFLFIIDTILIVTIPRLSKYRVALLILITLDILLTFQPLWFFIATWPLYLWLSSTIIVSSLSILHLVVLSWWDSRSTKGS